MKLGEKQVLTVVKTVDFGVYLGSDTERVLLPKKQVPSGIKAGEPIEVFFIKRFSRSGSSRQRGNRNSRWGNWRRWKSQIRTGWGRFWTGGAGKNTCFCRSDSRQQK